VITISLHCAWESEVLTEDRIAKLGCHSGPWFVPPYSGQWTQIPCHLGPCSFTNQNRGSGREHGLIMPRTMATLHTTLPGYCSKGHAVRMTKNCITTWWKRSPARPQSKCWILEKEVVVIPGDLNSTYQISWTLWWTLEFRNKNSFLYQFQTRQLLKEGYVPLSSSICKVRR
jgi:hypothetical protein